MKTFRVVLSDLHLGTGLRRGQLNPLEDFVHDDRFADLIRHYRDAAGANGSLELILNGDIFDLLKVKVGNHWPTEVTEEVAVHKLQQCLDGHPKFVQAIRAMLGNRNHRVTYIPGNHDLEMLLEAPQVLFRRYVAPEDAKDRVRFITASDTYYLPDGIQIRHGHQFESIHRIDYEQPTHKRRDGVDVLTLPWGSLWILEVMNPLKEERSHIDRILPLRRFLWFSLLIDPSFVFRFLWRSTVYFLRHRVFTFQAWRDRLANLPRLLREEVFELTSGYDERAMRSLLRMRGANTLIVGHSHGPRYVQQNGKLLVNTGTWVKMINLDLQYLGQDSGLTYAVIEYDTEGKPQTSLMRWYGLAMASEAIPYAD